MQDAVRGGKRAQEGARRGKRAQDAVRRGKRAQEGARGRKTAKGCTQAEINYMIYIHTKTHKTYANTYKHM